MSTFNQYNDILEAKIGNTSELFYDDGMKKLEFNSTLLELVQMFDIPSMAKKADLVFDADGLCEVPTDFVRMRKLFSVDTDGLQSVEYTYIDPQDTDGLGSSSSGFWTMDYDETSSSMKLKVYPNEALTLKARYYSKPVEIVDTTTDSGLEKNWDEAVVYGTVARVYGNAGRYEEAMFFKNLYNESTAKAWSLTRNPGGVKQNNRIKTILSRSNYLGGFRVAGRNNN